MCNIIPFGRKIYSTFEYLNDVEMKTRILVVVTLILMISAMAAAQKEKKPSGEQKKKILVTGYVTDSTNNPVQGAAIFLDGKKTNKLTDALGFYSVKVKPNTSKIMIFSFIHGGQEVDFNGQESINFILSPTLNPEDIPASIKADKSVMTPNQAAQDNTTTSIATLEGKKVQNQNYRTIYDMIEGEIPGVFVQGTSIVIRGPSSVNASSEALLVVDGAIVPSISHIPPGEVQSISVLKGSAAAIYGSRGANGVVVIKLKDGR